MNETDRKSAIASLRDWQRARLARDRAEPLPPPGPDTVTALAYFFRPPETAERHFPGVECAIRETWRHCGTMKTVLVTQAVTPPLAAFASQFPGLVEVQVEPSLKPLPPGDIASMSVDCNARLHTRFSTPWVLIVQDDGFPLRPGLEEFLGRWDYTGAPFLRRNWMTRLTGLWPHRAVGNGGFCLRSRRICEEANVRWPRFSGWRRDHRLLAEDVYYCLTLPLASASYRKSVSFAPLGEALRFSWDALYEEPPDVQPFGFHGAGAFALFRTRGWIAEP